MGAAELLLMYWFAKHVHRDEEKADFWREEYKSYMRSIQTYPGLFSVTKEKEDE